MKLKASELDASHLGQTIRFHGDGISAEGQLQGISHMADMIRDNALHDASEHWTPGRIETTATLEGGHAFNLSGAATVEITA